MGAIDRKDLERLSVDISNPARNLCRLAIRSSHDWIPVGGEARLAGRKLLKPPQGNPGVALAALARNRREEVAQDWGGQNESDNAVEHDSDLHEQLTPR